MTQPIISVNICMFNGAGFIAETLRSVFAQTLQDFEIVIVDDGSTDGSVELVETHFRDDRLSVIRQDHQTLRMARPMALAHSRGEFIAFLDSDDVWLPTKLERQLEAAREAPDAALVFCDAELIDAAGRPLGYFSDQFDYHAIDLTGSRAYLELLRRGNFLASPTPFARAAALRQVGGFNHSYQYVNDYEMWLRLARRYDVRFVNEPLARYRIHDTQYTQRNPHITLPEQCALLRPIYKSASFPPHVRVSIGDNLLGQHRLGWKALWRHRRYRQAARAAAGMLGYPDRVRDALRHRVSTTRVGPALETSIRKYHEGRNTLSVCKAQARNLWARVRLLARGAQSRATGVPRVPRTTPTAPRSQVWIDGTPLGGAQTGYFNSLVELIRGVVRDGASTHDVHVVADRRGRSALLARLGADGARVRFHRAGWRSLHWSDVHQLLFGWHAQLLYALGNVTAMVLGVAGGVRLLVAAGVAGAALQALVLADELLARLADARGHARKRQTLRVVRRLWRWVPAPRGHAPMGTTEILVWRGRFRWASSRRIAIVQDMTTRIHPGLHTPHNVAEFDEYLAYVQRHAHVIATPSEQSRADIVERIAICPDSVQTFPMPVHPQYAQPTFSRGIVRYHRLPDRYVLCVGTIEPRKNLRRLVKAFELVKHDSASNGLGLVIAGPAGWDPDFLAFLTGCDCARDVHVLGFVPLDHLPSLYHFASAVICPSVYEGFGLPVLEAMCCSGVVLASRISSLPEVLGEEGMLFDPYATDAIAAALLRATTLPAAEESSYRRYCRRRAELHLERIGREGPLPGVRPALTVVSA